MPTKGKVQKMMTKDLSAGVMEDNGNVMLMNRVDVNGEGAHHVFDFLKRHSSLYNAGQNTISPIPWNFAKFLVDPQGNVHKYYGPNDSLEALKPDIEALLTGVAS